MKKYLICSNFSYVNGIDGDISFTLIADDIISATETANQILDAVKSQLDFVIEFTVKSVSETTE